MHVVISFIEIRGQFHQRYSRSFYVRKLRTQLFCAYILGLYFTGVSLPAQKLRIEHWWNWAQQSCGDKMHSEKQIGEEDLDWILGDKTKYLFKRIFHILGCHLQKNFWGGKKERKEKVFENFDDDS
jgi:hypothetical protein